MREVLLQLLVPQAWITALEMAPTGSHVTLSPSADMHVHLRDGAMMETVTPLIRRGGVDTVYVMVSPEWAQ